MKVYKRTFASPRPETIYLAKIKSELTNEQINDKINRNMHLVRYHGLNIKCPMSRRNIVAAWIYKERFKV